MAAFLRKDGYQSSFWLGSIFAYELFQQMIDEPFVKQAAYMEKIIREMECYPYLFAKQSDGDTYRWLEELGCYSPIVHLQQTTGGSSAHLPAVHSHRRNEVKRSYTKPEEVTKDKNLGLFNNLY
jgi:hypothetical protein